VLLTAMLRLIFTYIRILLDQSHISVHFLQLQKRQGSLHSTRLAPVRSGKAHVGLGCAQCIPVLVRLELALDVNTILPLM
jgi:hypothetical protein